MKTTWDERGQANRRELVCEWIERMNRKQLTTAKPQTFFKDNYEYPKSFELNKGAVFVHEDAGDIEK